jgi:hypothetical protein
VRALCRGALLQPRLQPVFGHQMDGDGPLPPVRQKQLATGGNIARAFSSPEP